VPGEFGFVLAGEAFLSNTPEKWGEKQSRTLVEGCEGFPLPLMRVRRRRRGLSPHPVKP